MYDQGCHNVVGDTTHFYQSTCDVPSVMQCLCECIDLLKSEKKRLEGEKCWGEEDVNVDEVVANHLGHIFNEPIVNVPKKEKEN